MENRRPSSVWEGSSLKFSKAVFRDNGAKECGKLISNSQRKRASPVNYEFL